MRIKFKDITQNYESLKSVVDKVLPRKASMAIARNVVSLEAELKFYMQQKLDIAKRFAVCQNGEPVVDNGNYTFSSDEDKKSFIEEINQLNESEIDVDIMVFDASELDRCDEVSKYDSITPREEASLNWMISYE